MTANAIRDWVPLQPRRERVHRARLAVAERIRRELRRPRRRRAPRGRAVRLPDRGAGSHRGLAPGLQPPPPTRRAGDDDPRRVRRRLARGPPGGRARQRRTPRPLRVRSVRRRRQPYPAVTHHPPALTAGGPMNGSGQSGRPWPTNDLRSRDSCNTTTCASERRKRSQHYLPTTRPRNLPSTTSSVDIPNAFKETNVSSNASTSPTTSPTTRSNSSSQTPYRRENSRSNNNDKR